MTNAHVIHGRGYEGLKGFAVVNPDDQRFIPGRTVLVIPRGEEAPGWRAILAGYDTDGNAYVVPLQGHFGELRLRRLNAPAGLSLANDEPWAGSQWSRGDECDWTAAKVLALSTAQALDLQGRP